MASKWGLPQVVDSTMLSDFRSCPRKFYLSFVRKLGHPGLSVHLRAGGAFAKALEVARQYYVQGADPTEAEALGLMALIKNYGDYIPPDKHKNKSLEMTISAYLSYLERWPLETDPMRIMVIQGTHAIEFSFALPMPVNHPETGDPFLFAGRADCFMQYGRTVLVDDEKTTSYFTHNWADQWKLRAQFMAYTYAAREFGFKADGALVRGTAFKLSGIEHAEVIIQIIPDRLKRWYEQTVRDLERMVRLWHEDYFDYNFGDSCNAYGGCTFKHLCSVEDPEKWIEPLGFVERIWDPLHRQEEEK